MTTRSRRSIAATFLAAAAALCLTSCASSSSTIDAGTAAALPNQTYVDTSQSAEFDKLYAKLGDAMTDGHPVKGTMFKHASFGARHSDTEWDVEFVGDNISIRTRAQKGTGDELDTLHPAGSAYDYILLGPTYKSLAPTPWAKVPTNYHDPLNVCLVTGYQTVCDLEDAIGYTKDEHAHVTKRVTHNADGTTTLLTGVTLRAMLKNNFLLNVPTAISSQFTQSMLDYQLSTRFVINSANQIQIAEVVGVVPGKTDLVVQVGYQVTGAAQKSDIPAQPSPLDTTLVPYQTFYNGLTKINGA